MLTLLTNGKNFSFSAFPLELMTMKKMLNFKVLDMLTKADSILSYNVPHSMRNERLFAFKVPL